MNKENITNMNSHPVLSDKSNIKSNSSSQKYSPKKQSGLVTDSPKKKSSKRFASLLDEVSNELNLEFDKRMAVNQHMKEANQVLNEWATEEKDKKIAKEISDRLAEDEDAKRVLEVMNDERVALSLAISEKTRLQSHELTRNAESKSDQDFARNLIREDESLESLLLKDEEFARILQESEEKESKNSQKSLSVNRTRSLDIEKKSDRFLNYRRPNESIIGENSKQFGIKESISLDQADQKDVLEKKREQKAQSAARTEQFRIEMEKRRLKETQDKRDRMIARKIAINEARENFLLSKRSEILLSKSANKILTSYALIAKQWEDADAEVGNVANGICITVILPIMKSIKVRPSKSGRKILIDAERNTENDNESNGFSKNLLKSFFSSKASYEYKAEFQIVGSNVRVTMDDIHYSYIEDVGLVYIFVDKVQLDPTEYAQLPAKPDETGATNANEKESEIVVPEPPVSNNRANGVQMGNNMSSAANKLLQQQMQRKGQSMGSIFKNGLNRITFHHEK